MDKLDFYFNFFTSISVLKCEVRKQSSKFLTLLLLYFLRLFNYFNLNVNSKYIIILFNNSINNYFVCFYIFIIKSMQNRRFFKFNFYFPKSHLKHLLLQKSVDNQGNNLQQILELIIGKGDNKQKFRRKMIIC